MCTKKLLLLIGFLLFALTTEAQKLTVESLELAPMDLTASKYERLDETGIPCALVKVRLAAEGAAFSGNVLGEVENHEGEYWVYMSEGSYMLQVRHPQFQSLDVNFRDYGISGINSKTTYKLTLQIPSPGVVIMPTIESFTVKGVPFSMVHVEAGAFLMGNIWGEKDEQPAHVVTLSDFCIGQTEVTQELWEVVMDKNPSAFKGANRPVECIGWEDCQKFIQKLNKLTGRQFRLPTEAEWEYAARGGRLTKGYTYSGSNNINDVAWYMENSGDKYVTLGEAKESGYDDKCRQPHDVGTKLANELGIYDMSGNVSEWCEDFYGCYSSDAQFNPTGPSTGTVHVYHGGSWGTHQNFCRPSARGKKPYPSSRDYDLGLRLALQ